MQDKRSYRRFNYEKNIYLKLGKDASGLIEGKLLDISFAGVSLFIKENVNPDSLIQRIVEFDFASSVEQHLIGKGRIVYIKKQKLYAEEGFKFGLEFVEVNKEVALNIIDRLEAKILEEVRKRNQAPRKNPDLF